MNDKLRVELIEMARAEDAMRAEVGDPGDTEVLSADPHHELSAIRREHNARLREIIDQHGWPGSTSVGPDGAEAAWRLAMFAGDDRELQGRCLMLMEDIAEDGEIEAWQPAFLLDRLLVNDRKPQLYGSQFKLEGKSVVSCDISGLDGVDDRRKAIGAEPLAEALERLRAARA
jgi:hypothetical protein